MSSNEMTNVMICPYCDDKIDDLESHTKGSSKERKTFSCNNCDLAVFNKSCIDSHMKIVHDESKQIFSCESCNIDFSSKKHLFFHKNNGQIHEKSLAEDNEIFDIKLEITEEQKTETKEKHFKCDMCEKSLREHLNWHKGILIECKECPKKFQYTSNLGSHMKNFHPNFDISMDRVTCSICQKELKNKEYLKKHVKRIHEATYDFKCDLCEKAFTTKSNLKSHQISIHNNAKPYKCEKCDKTFKLKYSIGKHMRLAHSDIKRHQCGSCPKAFKTKTCLTNHELTMHNNGIRNFACNDCNSTFKTNSALNRHKALVHKNLRKF